MKLTNEQRCVIQLIYDAFRESGRWPLVGAIDRLADERWGLDVYPVLRSLPASIALLDHRHLRENLDVKLRVRAIAECENAGSDLELFVRATRWLAEKERAFRPASMHTAEQLQVSSEQFAADLASAGVRVDAVGLAKVYQLAAIENLSWGGSFDITGESGRWQINLTRDIRPFRRVETLEDFFAIRERLDRAAQEEAAEVSSGLTHLAGWPLVAADTVDQRKYVFIAMPFRVSWSEAVHECISRACQLVNADGLSLHWQRADEIARPGRITEQILDAITKADAVIADVSGLNPNVIYELGYAHASGVPLILLSQDPEASPFDLRDMRQIHYLADQPESCCEELVAHLRAALSTQARAPGSLGSAARSW